MSRLPLSNFAAAAALAAGLAAALGGCTGAVLGGGAAAGIGVAQERSVGDAIDDTTIATKLSAALLDDSFSLFRDVDLEVVEGRVLLTGKVPEMKDRLRAEELAWKVKGVNEVANAIQVTSEGGIGSYARDVRISNELRLAILGDSRILGINYSIETVGGVVYLIGIAQSEEELDRVIQHARSIKGVKKVESYVRLKDDPRRAG
ncbi:BON domain-containing protein [Minwuia thermotolerans]|uniref:BON domain-containing protein n=1 Tax=Minwuia thermotolerans TaxID=2056226 RepID=UPI000F6338C4|nr:BON domain-containing protein [Minwuia thermotolerans]